MRVVLDTNALISALLFKKRLSRLYESIECRALTLCFTEATFSELTEVLHRGKFVSAFRRADISVEEVIKFVKARSFICATPAQTPSLIPEDPFDNHILVAARVCGAICIVSGDKRITRLGHFEDIPILTPKQFLNAFQ